MRRNHLTGMIILWFVLLSNSARPQTVTVSGRLMDFKGNTSAYALIGISASEQENASDFVKTGSSGEYKIKITKPGMNFLMYSLPGHNAIRIPVLNDNDKEIKIDVKLAPYEYTDNFDDVLVIGSFNNFNFGSAEKMTKRDDGTYFFETESQLPEMKYQLYRIVKSGRTVNGTGSTAFEPDSSGDYRSVIPVVNGKAVIEFDPKLLPQTKPEVSVIFSDDPSDENFYKIYQEFNRTAEDAAQQIREYTAKHKTLEGFKYDAGKYVNNLLAEIDNAKNSRLADYLKLMYIRFAPYQASEYDYAKAAGFYENISPDNPAWDFMISAFYSYSSLFPQFKWKEIQDKFLSKSKSETVRLSILSGRLSMAKFQSNEEELKKLHELIKTEFPNSAQAKSMLAMFPVESKIKVGAEIPDFEVKSIDDENTVFSKKNMLGKIYMIDFWATWCGPCVGEMESIHKAYDKFSGKGFQILSLSLDQSVDDVVKFRNDNWKMPWLNTFLGTGDKSGTAKKFEVIGIPRPILVGADGKILALEADLRGNKLESTLEKYFK